MYLLSPLHPSGRAARQGLGTDLERLPLFVGEPRVDPAQPSRLMSEALARSIRANAVSPISVNELSPSACRSDSLATARSTARVASGPTTPAVAGPHLGDEGVTVRDDGDVELVRLDGNEERLPRQFPGEAIGPWPERGHGRPFRRSRPG